MGGRVSIEKERIVSAALEIVNGSGWEAVSARAIAARIGCSTMPIYSAIGSMDELLILAKLRAVEMLQASQRMARTDNPALDMAVGYVAFARESPRLFHFAISAEKGHAISDETGAVSDYGTQVADRIPEFRSILDAMVASAQGDFLLRSWIFTHGLAELVASGVVDMSDEEIIRHLNAAGTAFFTFHSKEGHA